MALPAGPRGNDLVRERNVNARCGVDVEVVGPKLVNLVLLNVGAALADTAVPSVPFSAVELITVAVHADEEDVETGK